MRILHIISSSAAGGAETYVRDMSTALRARGHEVLVAFISEPREIGRSDEFGRAFVAELEGAGVETARLGHACRRNPLLGAFKLRRVTRRFRPDIVHSHLYYGVAFLAPCAKQYGTVYTHHNITFGPAGRFFPLLDRFVDAYVAICAACQAELAARTQRPVRKIYNGIPLDRFACPERVQQTGSKVRLVSVGALIRQKNHTLLVDALAQVQRNRRAAGRWTCEIVGEGPQEGNIRKRIDEHSLRDLVTLPGNQRDIPRRLCEADLFVMSSRFEGLPIALIEAVASGLPAVVPDVGGCREIVGADPRVLVPPDDPDALAAALTRMIVDAQCREGAGRKNREASIGFGMDAAVEQHLELYEGLVR